MFDCAVLAHCLQFAPLDHLHRVELIVLTAFTEVDRTERATAQGLLQCVLVDLFELVAPLRTH